MAISKLKSALRKLAERTVAGLLAILEGCSGLFKPADCQSYFKACGYDPAELPALDTTVSRIPADALFEARTAIPTDTGSGWICDSDLDTAVCAMRGVV